VSYKDLQRDLAPPWLQQRWGTAWLEAKGEEKDALIDLLVDAVLARFAKSAPEDALALIGAEHGIGRYPGEGLETYRGRVLGALDSWANSGRPAGIQSAFAGVGYEATVLELRQVDAARWAEFEVYASSPVASAGDLVLLQAIVAQFKPARSKLAQMVLMEAPNTGYFGFDGDDEAFGFDDLTSASDAGVLAEIK
jgi:hypothetical protein